MNIVRRSERFTLVELLMVIVIIAILMGILLPTISALMEKARRTKAMAEIKAIETAVKAYESTYGYLPWSGSESELDDNDYKVLIGYLQNASSCDADSDTHPDDNFRGVRFLEVDNDQGIGEFEDPWGVKDESNTYRYRIIFDTNYDGVLSVGSPAETVYTSVAIWSKGKNQSDSKDDIKSWKSN